MLDVNEVEELKLLIRDSKDVRIETEENEIYKREMKKAIKHIMDNIEESKLKGLSYVCFSVSYKYEEDLKKLFKSKGYCFRPIGDIGGVWQLGEYIYW